MDLLTYSIGKGLSTTLSQEVGECECCHLRDQSHDGGGVHM